LANKSKQRWFYAFNIAPSDIKAAPANATPCPFLATMRVAKRPAEVDNGPNFIFEDSGGPAKRFKHQGRQVPETYVCKICNQPGHWIEDCDQAASKGRGSRKGREPTRELAPNECWFCLSNPNLAKHLIVSVGEETYLTLPKGQVPDTNDPTWPIPGGGHVLIVPIGHNPIFASSASDQAKAMLGEIEKVKSGLKKFYATHGCVMVTFEVSRPTGKATHGHIHICPIPSSMSDGIEKAFLDEAAGAGLDFVRDEEANNVTMSGNYFRLELPDGKIMAIGLRPRDGFHLQFGRIVVTKILGRPERAQWMDIAEDVESEKAHCEALKAAFAPFDPNTLS